MTTANPRTLIILIHAAGSSSRAYSSVVPLLRASNHTVLAIDLPGHGAANSQVPFTFEKSLKSVMDIIDTNTVCLVDAARPKVMLVGISLGGQVVLAFLQKYPNLVDAAVVSGVSTHPPDEDEEWEMPHMPEDFETIATMMEDAALAGADNMPELRRLSLGFTFNPVLGLGGQRSRARRKFPPVLVMVGEHDMRMARRDYKELTGLCQRVNEKSESLVLEGAWHNHNIDVPERFAAAVNDWAKKVL